MHRRAAWRGGPEAGTSRGRLEPSEATQASGSKTVPQLGILSTWAPAGQENVGQVLLPRGTLFLMETGKRVFTDPMTSDPPRMVLPCRTGSYPFSLKLGERSPSRSSVGENPCWGEKPLALEEDGKFPDAAYALPCELPAAVGNRAEPPSMALLTCFLPAPAQVGHTGGGRDLSPRPRSVHLPPSQQCPHPTPPASQHPPPASPGHRKSRDHG